jgi:hypothetical protein
MNQQKLNHPIVLLLVIFESRFNAALDISDKKARKTSSSTSFLIRSNKKSSFVKLFSEHEQHFCLAFFYR